MVDREIEIHPLASFMQNVDFDTLHFEMFAWVKLSLFIFAFCLPHSCHCYICSPEVFCYNIYFLAKHFFHIFFPSMSSVSLIVLSYFFPNRLVTFLPERISYLSIDLSILFVPFSITSTMYEHTRAGGATLPNIAQF